MIHTRNHHPLPMRAMLAAGTLAQLPIAAVAIPTTHLLGGQPALAAYAALANIICLNWPAFALRGWRTLPAATWMPLIMVWQAISALTLLFAGWLLYSPSRTGVAEIALTLTGGYLVGIVGQSVMYNSFVQRLPRTTQPAEQREAQTNAPSNHSEHVRRGPKE